MRLEKGNGMRKKGLSRYEMNLRAERISEAKAYIRAGISAYSNASEAVATAALVYGVTPTELARQTGAPIDWINKQLRRYGVTPKRRLWRPKLQRGRIGGRAKLARSDVTRRGRGAGDRGR